MLSVPVAEVLLIDTCPKPLSEPILRIDAPPASPIDVFCPIVTVPETVRLPEFRPTWLEDVFPILRVFANACKFAISAVLPELTNTLLVFVGTPWDQLLAVNQLLSVVGPCHIFDCPYRVDDAIEIRLKTYSQGLVNRKPTRKRGGKYTNIARSKFLDQVAISKKRRVSFFGGCITEGSGLLVEFP
jgi:hypothetical protein